MNIYLTGSRLYKLRKERKISQKDLCDGLCAISSLSRIETGTQVPSRKLIAALYQRCGYKAPVDDIPITESELIRDNIEAQLCVNSNNKQIDSLLDEYKNCSPQMNVFEEQKYILHSAINNSRKYGYTLEIKETFLKAFLFTHPNFKLADLEKDDLKLFLTKTEIVILNSIGNADIGLSKTKEAILIFSFLKNYFEKNIFDENEKTDNYPIILLNLSGLYDDIGEYEKSIELTETCIKLCAKYGKENLPAVITNYGFFIARQGNIEKGIKIIKDGLLFFEYLENNNFVSVGKETVKKYFSIDI